MTVSDSRSSERLFTIYERVTPPVFQRWLRPFFSDPRTLRWFVLYACIGAFGVAVYLFLAWLLSRSGIPVIVASGIAFASGATAQFLLNRNVNFRAFHRAAHRQARTYLVVMAINFALTLAIVSLSTRFLHATAEEANLLTLPFTFPMAYLANRYVTFA